MTELAAWLEIEPDTYERTPYDRPCPSCGDSMTYPTTCKCDFERRVWALCGFDGPVDPNRDNTIAVNKAMRALDDSGSWPISNRFNGTERAIQRVRKRGWDSLDEYVGMVDSEISRIVNSYP